MRLFGSKVIKTGWHVSALVLGRFESLWSVGSSAMERRFKIDDWVVYTREKHSLSPGKRAKNISPSPYGEMYSYEVDKFWIVRQIDDSEVVLETRTGKQHTITAKDRRLRKPSWWEKLFYSERFPRKRIPGKDLPNDGSVRNPTTSPSPGR